MTKPWQMARVRSQQRPRKRSVIKPVACNFVPLHSPPVHICLDEKRDCIACESCGYQTCDCDKPPQRKAEPPVMMPIVRKTREELLAKQDAAKQDRSEPPSGWFVHGRRDGSWHWGPVGKVAPFRTCMIGVCSCYEMGSDRKTGARNKFSRAEAVAACWDAAESERAKS